MNKKLLLLALFVVYLVQAGPNEESEEEGLYAFELKYSEAVNALEERDYGLATKIARVLMTQYENRPEGFIIFADAHRREGLCDQAMVYYQKALALHSKFLLEIDALNLLLGMAGCYEEMKNIEQEMTMYRDIIQWVDDKNRQKVPAFAKIRGAAYYLMGISHLLVQKKKTAGRLYLLQSIKGGFSKKTNYLWLAYYYAKNTQEDIADNNMIHYRKKVKNENRDASFEHFYRLFVREPADEYFESTKDSAWHKKALNAVKNFRNTMLQQQKNAKNADENMENTDENLDKDAHHQRVEEEVFLQRHTNEK